MLVAETKAGGRADSTGTITISHPPGVLTLYVSAIGYIRGREPLVLDFNKRVEYLLQPRSTDLEEVDVRATREDKNIKAVQMGQIQLSMPELKRMPVVLGEPDILKALTLQAGVTTSGYHLHVDGVTPNLTFQFTSHIEQREGKADLFYTLNQKHKIQVEANAVRYDVRTGDNSSINPQYITPERGRELGT